MFHCMIDKHQLIMVSVLVGSIGLAGIGISRAQTASSTTSSTVDMPISTAATTTIADTQSTPPVIDQSKGGHVGANGITETLLTGDAAAKASAAALKAVPGGTILRVETDAEGAAYEAHMTKSDGTQVTIKMDKDFNVTATEAGCGQPHQ